MFVVRCGAVFALLSVLLEPTAALLVYTYNSATGVLVALSIPLVIPSRNIFVAYNFEANYGMPINSTDYTQGVLKRVDNEQLNQNQDGRAVRSTLPRRSSSITRKKIYRTIEVNLERNGFNGKRCILRMICDLASGPVHEQNGVVGDLLQVIFTPSHSKDEQLPGEFYLAEELGLKSNCTKYVRHCPTSPLDMQTITLDICDVELNS